MQRASGEPRALCSTEPGFYQNAAALAHHKFGLLHEGKASASSERAL